LPRGVAGSGVEVDVGMPGLDGGGGGEGHGGWGWLRRWWGGVCRRAQWATRFGYSITSTPSMVTFAFNSVFSYFGSPLCTCRTRDSSQPSRIPRSERDTRTVCSARTGSTLCRRPMRACRCPVFRRRELVVRVDHLHVRLVEPLLRGMFHVQPSDLFAEKKRLMRPSIRRRTNTAYAPRARLSTT
jgi:hypothetical protein